MSLRVFKPVWLLSFLFLSATSSSRHSAWVIINNTDPDGQAIDMKITLTDKKEGSSVVADQEVPAGLQRLPEKKLSDGTYRLTVSAHNKLVEITQPITLDSDRWIIINYIRTDSATIVKNEGWLDTNRYKKINGQYATVTMYVDSRRPANL